MYFSLEFRVSRKVECEGQLLTNAVSVTTLTQAFREWLERFEVLVLDFNPLLIRLYLYG
jgi:hypothetical protein